MSGTATLSADASDNLALDHVDFLLNGTVVATVGAVPYSAAWDSTSVVDGLVSKLQGAYDLQRTHGEEHETRGNFRTDEEGRFWFRSITPLGYEIPMDGPVGELIRAQLVKLSPPAPPAAPKAEEKPKKAPKKKSADEASHASVLP